MKLNSLLNVRTINMTAVLDSVPTIFSDKQMNSKRGWDSQRHLFFAEGNEFLFFLRKFLYRDFNQFYCFEDPPVQLPDSKIAISIPAGLAHRIEQSIQPSDLQTLEGLLVSFFTMFKDYQENNSEWINRFEEFLQTSYKDHPHWNPQSLLVVQARSAQLLADYQQSIDLSEMLIYFLSFHYLDRLLVFGELEEILY